MPLRLLVADKTVPAFLGTSVKSQASPSGVSPGSFLPRKSRNVFKAAAVYSIVTGIFNLCDATSLLHEQIKSNGLIKEHAEREEKKQNRLLLEMTFGRDLRRRPGDFKTG